MKKTMIATGIILLALYLAVLIFFFLKQESILFHPSKTSAKFSYNFPYTFEEVYFKTPAEGNIHALKFNVEDPKGIVLYFHGNAGNLEDWGWVYQNFVKHQYDVLVIDYRSFGKSTGQLSEANMHSDAAFIYQKLKAEYQEENIVVYGRSIGTGVATRLAAEQKPKLLILETPYFNIEDLAKPMLPFLPVKYLLKYRFESNKFITQVDAPIYILHGTADNVVPYASGQKLFELVKDEASFTTFEKGTHSNLATFKDYHILMENIL